MLVMTVLATRRRGCGAYSTNDFLTMIIPEDRHFVPRTVVHDVGSRVAGPLRSSMRSLEIGALALEAYHI